MAKTILDCPNGQYPIAILCNSIDKTGYKETNKSNNNTKEEKKMKRRRTESFDLYLFANISHIYSTGFVSQYMQQNIGMALSCL